jgi:hypothetical protein
MGFIDRLSGTSFKSNVEALPATVLSREEVDHLYAEYQSLGIVARTRVDAWLAKKRPALRKALRARTKSSSDTFQAVDDSTEK